MTKAERRKLAKIERKLRRRLGKLYEKLGDDVLERALRDVGDLRTAAGKKSFERFAARELQKTTAEALRVTTLSVTDAAVVGAEGLRRAAIKEVGRAIAEIDVDDLVSKSTKSVTSGRSAYQAAASDSSRARASALRTKIAEGALRAQKEFSFIVEEAMSSAAGIRDVRKVAHQMLESGKTRSPTVPQYIDEVLKSLEGSGKGEYKKAARKLRAIARKQGVRAGEAIESGLTIRPATKKLAAHVEQISTMEKAVRKDAMRTAVKDYLERKAQYNSIRTARTEMMSAANDAYIRGAQDKPYVAALRWTRGSSSTQTCDCDTLASQDLFGLGRGVYPKGAYPSIPHPQCICSPVAVIDKNYARRLSGELPPLKKGRPKKPTTYFRKLKKSERVRQMGKGRAKLFESHPNAVVRDDGTMRTLKEATKIAKRR